MSDKVYKPVGNTPWPPERPISPPFQPNN